MRLFLFLLCFSSVLVLSSCDSNTDEPTDTETTEPAAAMNEEEATQVADTQPQKTETGTVVTAVYKSATVYTGKTEYEFTTVAGDRLLASVGNFEKNRNAEIPDNMVESGEDLEGPPAANPAMVGKTFKLYYDKKGKLYKIETTGE